MSSEVVIKTKLDTSGVQSGIADIDRELGGAGRSADGFGNMAASGLKVVAAAATAATAAVGGMASYAVSVGSSFESSMSQVAATMGMTAAEIEGGAEDYKILEEAARECGETTMYSASEAAQALNYLALAGYDAKKSAETLPKVLSLAAAGGMDLATASDMVTDSMAALGMETSELDKYINEMAVTAQKSNTSVSQLGEATITVAGMISTTGQSLETMNAELGILANNGIKGAEGGTHLRNILLSLSGGTDQAKKAIASMNVEIYDSEGNMRDLNDILTDMNAAMNNMSQEDKTNMISTIFNKTDIAAVNALLKGTGEEFDNLVANIEAADGAASNMAGTMQDNLQGKLTILRSSLEGLGISAYKVFEGPMKSGVDAATKSIGRFQKEINGGRLGAALERMGNSLANFTERALELAEKALPVLIDGVSWLIDNLGTVVAAFVGFKVALIAYSVAVKAADIATKGLSATILANPVGLMIAALAGLTAAAVIYGQTTGKIVEQQSEAVTQSREMISAWQDQKKGLEDTAAAYKENVANIKANEEEANRLINTLSNLQHANGGKGGALTEQQRIIEQLNTLMPDLNLSIDEQTGKLNQSISAIKEHAKALMQDAKAEAAKARATEVASEQIELEKTLFELNTKQNDLTREQKEAWDNYVAVKEKYSDAESRAKEAAGEMNQELQTAQDRFNAAKDAAQQNQKAVNETQEAIEGCTDEYERLNNYVSDAAPFEAGAEAIENVGEAAEDAAEGMRELSEAAEEVAKNVEDSITSQISVFEKYSSDVKASTDGVLQAMQSNAEYVENWSANLQELANRGISQGILAELANMGPQGAAYVQAFVDATGPQFEEMQSAWDKYQTAVGSAANAAGEGFDKAAEAASVVWDETAKAWVDASEAAENAAASGEEAAQSHVDAAKETALNSYEQVGSAIKKGQDSIKGGVTENAKEAGKEAGESYTTSTADAITDGEDEVNGAIEKMGDAAYAEAQNDFKSSRFQAIGTQIATGIATGITVGTDAVIKAIQTTAEQAIAEASIAVGGAAKKISAAAGGGASTNSLSIGTNMGGKINAATNAMQQSATISAVTGNMTQAMVMSETEREYHNETAASGQDVNVNVVLEGDAQGVFRLVRQENRKFINATGKNGLTPAY